MTLSTIMKMAFIKATYKGGSDLYQGVALKGKCPLKGKCYLSLSKQCNPTAGTSQREFWSRCGFRSDCEHEAYEKEKEQHQK